MPRPKTDRATRTLRLPRELDAQVKSAAQENSRSFNAEVTQRLRASLQGYSLDLRR